MFLSHSLFSVGSFMYKENPVQYFHSNLLFIKECVRQMCDKNNSMRNNNQHIK